MAFWRLRDPPKPRQDALAEALAASQLAWRELAEALVADKAEYLPRLELLVLVAAVQASRQRQDVWQADASSIVAQAKNLLKAYKWTADHL